MSQNKQTKKKTKQKPWIHAALHCPAVTLPPLPPPPPPPAPLLAPPLFSQGVPPSTELRAAVIPENELCNCVSDVCVSVGDREFRESDFSLSIHVPVHQCGNS